MNFTYDLCPICHNTYPSPALPAHLRAHARAVGAALATGAMTAAVIAEDLAGRSNREIADMLKVMVWVELNPLSWESAVVEAAIGRLEAMR